MENKGFRLRYGIFLLFSVFLILSLISHNNEDFAVIAGGSNHAFGNWIGALGAYISCGMFLFFGVASYVIAALLIVSCFRLLLPIEHKRRGYISSFIICCFGVVILFGMYPNYFVEITSKLGIGREQAPFSALSGGLIGQFIASPAVEHIQAGFLRRYIGTVGIGVFAGVLVFIGMVSFYISDWHSVLMHFFKKQNFNFNFDIPEAMGNKTEKQQKKIAKKLQIQEQRLKLKKQHFELKQKEKQFAEEVRKEKLKDKKSSFSLFGKQENKKQDELDLNSVPNKIADAEEENSKSVKDKIKSLREKQSGSKKIEEAEVVEQDNNLSPLMRKIQEKRKQSEQQRNDEQSVDFFAPDDVHKNVADQVNRGNGSLKSQNFKSNQAESKASESFDDNYDEVEETDIRERLNIPKVVNKPTINNVQKDNISPRTFNDNSPVLNKVSEGDNFSANAKSEFILPPVSMLSKGAEVKTVNEAEIEQAGMVLQETLESFKVEGQVTNIISGPRVTRYEVSLASGVKVEKVTAIANNIAMDLAAESIRILAPVPGRKAVGVEVPNPSPSAVFMRNLMECDYWQNNKSDIPIVLGKDVAGKPVITDLAKTPHLLIAGATGSGKSVCMNTLIMSLLFKFSPEDLRLIMIDPKVVEMEMYTSLPHLITPVVNDPQKVPIALRWAVNEMEKRYRTLAKARVKNLNGYNSRDLSGEPVYDDNGEELPEKLPYLVIIVDELADVMMTDAKSDVETSIARIAQKGRAAGIHIVIATQRPSTNIITGVIKANLPTRIAFRVGSLVDSRVILDQKGAETLLGRGDMLFIPPGSANLERIQGAMVEDSDIEKVVEFVSGQVEQRFNDNVVANEDAQDENGSNAADAFNNSIDDAVDISPIVAKYLQSGDSELMQKALEITLLERKVSTSYIQRRLRIGYNRAAEIIDSLEERGIVSPPLPGGSKREILVFDEIDNNL
ncbi:DNA translocase FtsK 4TM domain-containing protein [Lentisphaerota bacterium WC36G]|nr:DNA translocase FtsK 4TM domain-containing protein [Lentisphaerae bacterium WC36]